MENVNTPQISPLLKIPKNTQTFDRLTPTSQKTYLERYNSGKTGRALTKGLNKRQRRSSVPMVTKRLE